MEDNKKITVLITGGSGYVASVFLKNYLKLSSSPRSRIDCQNHHSGQLGSHAGQCHGQPQTQHLQNVARVLLVDQVEPHDNVDDYDVPVSFHQVDISNADCVNDLFRGVDVVYHLASYGMSGREQLHKEMIWKVNVQGTANVVRACQLNNVKSLIFTSTVNVVFGGQKIEGGDESLPYFDKHERPWDNYGNSKALAEVSVLQANNELTADGVTRLRTCVLRLPGIYGPNERRHIPRVVGLMKQGLFKATYGDNPVVEFIHVENVHQALVLATRSLLSADAKAAGNAYFVSDGAPINNFEFFRPLTEALDIPFPRICVPTWLVFYLAHMIEVVYCLLYKYYDFQPLLCRAEVYKTGQTHYFSIEKARRELGYSPTYQNDMSEIAEHFKTLHSQKSRNKGHSFTKVLVDVCLVIIAVCLLMSFLPLAS